MASDTDEEALSGDVVYRVDGLSNHQSGRLLSAVAHRHGRDHRLYHRIELGTVRGTADELAEITHIAWDLAVSDFDTTLGSAAEAIDSVLAEREDHEPITGTWE